LIRKAGKTTRDAVLKLGIGGCRCYGGKYYDIQRWMEEFVDASDSQEA
jgi:hypothetical protein